MAEIEPPGELIRLRREVNVARREAATRAYGAAGWKPWLDAVVAFHEAVTEYAKEMSVSQDEVEKVIEIAARTSEAPPGGRSEVEGE